MSKKIIEEILIHMSYKQLELLRDTMAQDRYKQNYGCLCGMKTTIIDKIILENIK